MAKAKSKHTTKWIRYGRAKALAVAYLGNAALVVRLIKEGAAAGEIQWQCVRFDTREGYSGPGPGDPAFFRKPDDLIKTVGGILFVNLEWLTYEGDSIKHLYGAVASGVELNQIDLVRLKILPTTIDGADDDGGISRPSPNPIKKKPQRPNLAKLEANKL